MNGFDIYIYIYRSEEVFFVLMALTEGSVPMGVFLNRSMQKLSNKIQFDTLFWGGVEGAWPPPPKKKKKKVGWTPEQSGEAERWWRGELLRWVMNFLKFEWHDLDDFIRVRECGPSFVVEIFSF